MTSQAVDGPGTAVASRASRRSGLTPEREQEFFDAVLERIHTRGYDGVTMEGIAAATRCGTSTLCRQWGTKPRFVAAAPRSSSRPRFAGIGTGSLAEDLRQVVRVAGGAVGGEVRRPGLSGPVHGGRGAARARPRFTAQAAVRGMTGR